MFSLAPCDVLGKPYPKSVHIVCIALKDSRRDSINMRHFKTLALHSSATLALLGALSFTAQAQVSVTADTSEQIRTSTAGDGGVADDVTVDEDVTVTIDSARSGLVVDSDNSLTLIGNVNGDDINGATGVELFGNNSGSYTQSGNISLEEDFTAENTDDDGFIDGPFAVGEGRTGILISGADPFEGNVELAAGSVISVEGNDSFGINLSNTPMTRNGLTGDLTTAGQIAVLGDRSTGVNIASGVTGDVTNSGTVAVRGADSQAFVISGDILDGGFSSSGVLSASGFRFDTRLAFVEDENISGRESLTAEDLQQAGSALNISGNIAGGVFLNQTFVPAVDADGAEILDEEGNPTDSGIVATSSAISQFGSAPAVLIAGDGTPITLGLVTDITDPDAEGFDGALQFGFINQGTITSSGVFDDVDATTVSFSNVTIDGGVSNSGNLGASTFRGAIDSDLADGEAVARVLVFGNQAMADQINNSGVIIAAVSESADQIFFDRENIIAPRDLLAVSVDIGAGASIPEIINSGQIQANLTGREGTAIAIRDTSGTVTSLNNTGFISANATTSDILDLEETDFNLVAVDFSGSTNSIEINQSQNPDSANIPFITGDILLGSGDDTITASSGGILGDIDFGGGSDTLTLSGNTAFAGAIRNTDGLSLSVTDGASFGLATDEDVQIADASFDGTSVFRPLINGATGDASALVSENNITFESGASITPVFESILGSPTTSFTLASAGDLTIGDLAALGGTSSSFLFDTNLEFNPSTDPTVQDTLVVTIDLRDPTASIEDGGLGLDSVQAAAFGTVVDGELQNGAVLQTLGANSELGDAFTNIAEADDFYAAYNQLLPEFSGAAKQFVLANVDGAVGSVSSHLESARRSPDQTGGAWLQEFFYFADRELAGRSEQYRGDGFGFTGGLDTAFGPFHAVGVNLGFASTEVEDVIGVDEPLNVTTYQAGAYAGLEKNGLSVDLYGGGGISNFEQTRFVSVGDFFGRTEGEWDGVHANGSLRAGYDVAINDKYWVRPSLSLDYLYLKEDGFTETGTDGIRISVEDRTSETAAATALLNFGAHFQGKRTWIRPSVRVGYRNEFLSDPVETAFRFQGLTDSSGGVFDSEIARLRAFAFPDEGILLGFTVAAGSKYSSIGFDFDSDIRDGFIRHTGRIVIRLLF